MKKKYIIVIFFIVLFLFRDTKPRMKSFDIDYTNKNILRDNYYQLKKYISTNSFIIFDYDVIPVTYNIVESIGKKLVEISKEIENSLSAQ